MPVHDIVPKRFEASSLHEDLQSHLICLAEPSYQAFAAALLPGTGNLLGVRLPVLRQLASKLAKGDTSRYLSRATDTYFEETMLQVMVTGLAAGKLPLDQAQSLITAFVPRIQNWSVCDSFCAGLKFVKKSRAEYWDFVTDYLKSKEEFHFRFGAVMLLNHYLAEDWIDDVLDVLFTHPHDDYYAKMATAWALSQAFAFAPYKTLRQMEMRGFAAPAASPVLDPFVQQKTIQKILESNKVSSGHKAMIKRMKEGQRSG